MGRTTGPIRKLRSLLRFAMSCGICVALSGCCTSCPALCPEKELLGSSYGDPADRSERSVEGLRELTLAVGRTVRANPQLAARAASLAEDWRPLLDGLRSGRGAEVTVTPQMVAAVEAVLPELLAAADGGLARRLRSLEARLELESLVGASADQALASVLAALGSASASTLPDAFTLAPRERGLARAGHTLLVPAAAHVSGAQGTRWRTDLMVVNPARVPATFTIAMLRRNADNSTPQTVTLELAPGASAFYEDVLDVLFSSTGAASLRLTVTSGAITVTSRTYNLLGPGNALGLPPGSTFGQFVPALSEDDAIPFGDEGRLIQLSHDPGLEENGRTNLILVSGCPVPITVEIDLHDGAGPMIGRLSRQLSAWEYIQLDRIFEELTDQPVANGYAVVRITTPGGRLFALASVVDNRTGDPIAIPTTLASYQTERTLNESLTVPAAAHVTGAAGTNWRTDMVLHHLSGANTLAVVELLRRGQANPQPEQRQVPVGPGQALRYDDVLVSLFETEGAAALRVTAYGGPLSVSSRTYNLLEAGNQQGLPAGSTFGQYLAPVGWLQAIRPGDEAWLGHLSHDPSLTDGSRTNLVLVNNATRDAEYEIELFQGDGSSLGSFTTTLGQWEYSQIDRVFERVTSERVDGGYLVVRAVSPWGVFHAQASVVDNRTGDPITIDAVVIRAPRRGGLVEAGNMLFGALADGSLPMQELLLQLTADDSDALLDAFAAAAPDYVTRTPAGIVVDAGLGESTVAGYIAGGRVELELADDFSSGGGQASGGFVLRFDGFHVDGVSPAVDSIQGSLDLEQVAADHVAGTITLGSPSLAQNQLSGSAQVDTRICAMFPTGGSISLTINNELRTISFSELCDGSYAVNIPSASHHRYTMRVQDCGGGWQEDWDTIFLISEDGYLAADPSAPVPYGRGTWNARGLLSYGDVRLFYGRSSATSPDGVTRVGWFRGTRNEPVPGTIYYSGVYGYRVRFGDCVAFYNHSRRDPDFWAALLEPCDGPCAP